MTNGPHDPPGGVNRDWVGQLAVLLIGALISSGVSTLTKLQPLAVFAAAGGVALLVVIELRSPRTTGASNDLRAETLGVAIGFALLFLASYLLVRSL